MQKQRARNQKGIKGKKEKEERAESESQRGNGWARAQLRVGREVEVHGASLAPRRGRRELMRERRTRGYTLGPMTDGNEATNSPRLVN